MQTGRRLSAAALLLLLLIVGPVSVAAEETAPESSPFFFRLEGLRRYFAWGWDLIPTGLDLTVGYSGWRLFPELDTTLQLTVGGGYEGFGTYRAVDYTPNSPVDPPEGAAGDDLNLEFNSPNFQWELGIRQGILWNRSLDRNLLEALLFYRGRYDLYLKGRHYWGTDAERIAAIESYHESWQANYPGSDARGIFGNSFLFGLALDNLRHNRKTKAYDGSYAEITCEISPYFPSVLGASDFVRLNFSTRNFKTLYEARPEEDKNVFTIYAGSFFSIDYAFARRQMPLYVMQSFGGTKLREGLGKAVRGFEKYSWDTQLKLVHNLDLRFNLPALFHSDLVPGFLLYFDLGYGTGFWGDPSAAPGGFLGSTGIGLYLDLLDLDYIRFNVNFPLIGKRLDRAPVALDLDLHLQF